MAKNSNKQGPHTFHIPVMGTSFTVDSPVKIGQFGISSVVSIMDDYLTERMRKYYCEKTGEVYEEIDNAHDDKRARRISEYLNLLKRMLMDQVKTLQESPFIKGSDITKYFEMLPDIPLKKKYHEMLSITDETERSARQEELRTLASPGSIDVNIMTKVDALHYKDGEELPPETSDAMASLRGFALSDLDSSVVFSAGLNPKLYAYAAKFKDFLPNAEGMLKKKIVLKVSDYRSAAIQGRFLAKHGLWISEYRIESGVNCGGHAFTGAGNLLGPILEEFRNNRDSLKEKTFTMYKKGLTSLGMEVPEEPFEMRITVQGGVCSSEEHALLMERYGVDATGWGTPFLLVPEASTVDQEHMAKLAEATLDDVYLSDSSPFGIPFWNLKTSASEAKRKKMIDSGTPGIPCTQGILKLNPDFGIPALCSASRSYMKKKLASIDEGDYNDEQRSKLKELTMQRACICVDLGGSADKLYGLREAAPCICPGPSIAYFDRIYSLEEMVSHIYGRISLLIGKENRPHMFIKELSIYIEHLKKELEQHALDISIRTPKYFDEFRENLSKGIEYYQGLGEEFIEEKKEGFLADLEKLKKELENITPGKSRATGN
jgi:hypothetical protein